MVVSESVLGEERWGRAERQETESEGKDRRQVSSPVLENGTLKMRLVQSYG